MKNIINKFEVNENEIHLDCSEYLTNEFGNSEKTSLTQKKISEIVSVDVPCDIIYNTWVKYDTGELVISHSAHTTKKIYLTGYKDITIYTYHYDTVPAAIAYYDENDVYLKEQSIQSLSGFKTYYIKDIPLIKMI